MIRAAALAWGLAGAAMAESTHTLMSFSDLRGWSDDDHAAALETFLVTCGDLPERDWSSLCALARTGPEPRSFFESFFQPVLVEDGDDALFTGYFEPELSGARQPDSRFRYPVYRLPPEAEPGPYLTRREIEEDKRLSGRGLEIAWVDDAVELFFLQVQGSGRIRLPDGQMIRVGFGGANGHPYSSVGEELVARGIFERHEVSAPVIRNWVRNNPGDGYELLWTNRSYVFFREVNDVPAEKGPLGAMNRSITPLRSVAIDPDHVPLGAPVWIEKDGAYPFNRLMVAQDTGSAIKGAQRADVFYGTGDAAGRAAGRVRDTGRMVVLLPIQRAHGLIPEVLK